MADPAPKITDLISSFSSDGPPYFSLEFFPPKTASGFTNLQARIARMVAALHPLFVTVTWGAGGTTSQKSLELAEVCQRRLRVPTVLHLTCTNMKRKVLKETLDQWREMGGRNVLALRGDPPREEYKDLEEIHSENGEDEEEEGEELVWAVDLVRYIRKHYGTDFCVGVAGYPEGHADESNPEIGKQNTARDLPFLAAKVLAGADFIMTQLTYDVAAYAAYEELLRNYKDGQGRRVFEGVPVIPGLMPIQSYAVLKRVAKLSHAKVPSAIAARIEQVKSDDEAVKRLGVDIFEEMVDSIKALPSIKSMPRGLHFYTLNLEKSVAFILERCRLIPLTKEPSPEESSDSDVVVDGAPMATNGTTNHNHASTPRFSRRRASSVNAQPHNRVILDKPSKSPEAVRGNGRTSAAPSSSSLRQHEAPNRGTGIPASNPTQSHNLLISEGQGSLGREATWDDFPNGRWGPSHSPAFGEIDGYGPSLKVGPVTARRLWGSPRTPADVTELFRQHVLGQLEAVPWSDDVDVDGPGSGGAGALRAETQVIRTELLGLIEQKGYLTLASQPAVNGVSSADSVFGWGPKGEGFVFQKAFVEFFCRREEWESVLRPKLAGAPATEFSWMKIDASGQFESSEMIHDTRLEGKPTSRKTAGSSAVNAVTWGVFRGKEIVTPTIIESESFRAWGEEAYSVWGEWRRCFPRGSEEEQCLAALREGVVLVNVVGQQFIGGHDGAGGDLWRLLLGE